MILSIIFVITISPSVYAKEALVNVDNLNVRSGPGLNTKTIGQIGKGESYTVLEENAKWVKIQLGDTEGWVTKEYITTKGGSQGEEQQSSTTNITLQYDQTNIRNGPSTSKELIGFGNSGETFEVKSQQNGWYEIEWEGNKGFVAGWVVRPGPSSNKPVETKGFDNKTIIIDPGHGGRDVGAIGESGNYEKEYTLRTAKELKSKLEVLGAEVILTRTKDNYMTLSGRASISNTANADVFLSLHYNSFPQQAQVNGAGTFYYQDKNQELAKFVQASLIKETGMEDRGTQYGDFQVIRENYQPAILLELGFISNTAEEQHIKSYSFQEKIAAGIINGLSNYFSHR